MEGSVRITNFDFLGPTTTAVPPLDNNSNNNNKNNNSQRSTGSAQQEEDLGDGSVSLQSDRPGSMSMTRTPAATDKDAFDSHSTAASSGYNQMGPMASASSSGSVAAHQHLKQQQRGRENSNSISSRSRGGGVDAKVMSGSHLSKGSNSSRQHSGSANLGSEGEMSGNLPFAFLAGHELLASGDMADFKVVRDQDDDDNDGGEGGVGHRESIPVPDFAALHLAAANANNESVIGVVPPPIGFDYPVGPGWGGKAEEKIPWSGTQSSATTNSANSASASNPYPPVGLPPGAGVPSPGGLPAFASPVGIAAVTTLHPGSEGDNDQLGTYGGGGKDPLALGAAAAVNMSPTSLGDSGNANYEDVPKPLQVKRQTLQLRGKKAPAKGTLVFIGSESEMSAAMGRAYFHKSVLSPYCNFRALGEVVSSSGSYVRVRFYQREVEPTWVSETFREECGSDETVFDDEGKIQYLDLTRDGPHFINDEMAAANAALHRQRLFLTAVTQAREERQSRVDARQARIDARAQREAEEEESHSVSRSATASLSGTAGSSTQVFNSVREKQSYKQRRSSRSRRSSRRDSATEDTKTGQLPQDSSVPLSMTQNTTQSMAYAAMLAAADDAMGDNNAGGGNFEDPLHHRPDDSIDALSIRTGEKQSISRSASRQSAYGGDDALGTGESSVTLDDEEIDLDIIEPEVDEEAILKSLPPVHAADFAGTAVTHTFHYIGVVSLFDVLTIPLRNDLHGAIAMKDFSLAVKIIEDYFESLGDDELMKERSAGLLSIKSTCYLNEGGVEEALATSLMHIDLAPTELDGYCRAMAAALALGDIERARRILRDCRIHCDVKNPQTEDKEFEALCNYLKIQQLYIHLLKDTSLEILPPSEGNEASTSGGGGHGGRMSPAMQMVGGTASPPNRRFVSGIGGAAAVPPPSHPGANMGATNGTPGATPSGHPEIRAVVNVDVGTPLVVERAELVIPSIPNDFTTARCSHCGFPLVTKEKLLSDVGTAVPKLQPKLRRLYPSRTPTCADESQPSTDEKRLDPSNFSAGSRQFCSAGCRTAALQTYLWSEALHPKELSSIFNHFPKRFELPPHIEKLRHAVATNIDAINAVVFKHPTAGMGSAAENAEPSIYASMMLSKIIAHITSMFLSPYFVDEERRNRVMCAILELVDTHEMAEAAKKKRSQRSKLSSSSNASSAPSIHASRSQSPLTLGAPVAKKPTPPASSAPPSAARVRSARAKRTPPVTTAGHKRLLKEQLRNCDQGCIFEILLHACGVPFLCHFCIPDQVNPADYFRGHGAHMQYTGTGQHNKQQGIPPRIKQPSQPQQSHQMPELQQPQQVVAPPTQVTISPPLPQALTGFNPPPSAPDIHPTDEGSPLGIAKTASGNALDDSNASALSIASGASAATNPHVPTPPSEVDNFSPPCSNIHTPHVSTPTSSPEAAPEERPPSLFVVSSEPISPPTGATPINGAVSPSNSRSQNTNSSLNSSKLSANPHANSSPALLSPKNSMSSSGANARAAQASSAANLTVLAGGSNRSRSPSTSQKDQGGSSGNYIGSPKRRRSSGGVELLNIVGSSFSAVSESALKRMVTESFAAMTQAITDCIEAEAKLDATGIFHEDEQAEEENDGGETLLNKKRTDTTHVSSSRDWLGEKLAGARMKIAAGNAAENAATDATHHGRRGSHSDDAASVSVTLEVLRIFTSATTLHGQLFDYLKHSTTVVPVCAMRDAIGPAVPEHLVDSWNRVCAANTHSSLALFPIASLCHSASIASERMPSRSRAASIADGGALSIVSEPSMGDQLSPSVGDSPNTNSLFEEENTDDGNVKLMPPELCPTGLPPAKLVSQPLSSVPTRGGGHNNSNKSSPTSSGDETTNSQGYLPTGSTTLSSPSAVASPAATSSNAHRDYHPNLFGAIRRALVASRPVAAGEMLQLSTDSHLGRGVGML